MTILPPGSSEPIRIGISSCLLGEKVRYDGGHKRDPYVTGILGRFFEWVPVCPEIGIGLGAPREPIHLRRQGDEIRLVSTRTAVDLTERMRRWSEPQLSRLARESICGFIVKKDSPSCGMERVKVHPEKGSAVRQGRGIFTEALMARFPNLPVEEEGRLCDPALRENWVERVFAYHAIQNLWRSRWTVGHLVEFHTRYKLLLLAHSEPDYRALGRLVAGARRVDRDRLREEYEARFMAALAHPATPRKHANVLEHMLGYFKKDLDPADRQEILGHIHDHRRGFVPLVVPLTLIGHHVRRLGIRFLAEQAYLSPHPKELSLRNHV